MSIFADEVRRSNRTKTMLISLMVLAVAAGVLSMVKQQIVNQWISSKENVACVPSELETSVPAVYYQTSYHPVNNDTKIKNFVEQYVDLTKNESYVDYHALTKDARYIEQAKFSQRLWTAIDMSFGLEKSHNMEKYAKSSETYKFLKEKNIGWIFLIDAILIGGIDGSGVARVVVRGEYQLSPDQVRNDAPYRLYGYKEITYLVSIGAPSATEDGQAINKWGLYVIESFERDLSPIERNKLYQASHDSNHQRN